MMHHNPWSSKMALLSQELTKGPIEKTFPLPSLDISLGPLSPHTGLPEHQYIKDSFKWQQ